MSVRKDRQNTILRLIGEEPISTQDDLIRKLRSYGYDVTQATVSRDIKELKLIKTVGPRGKSIYSINQSDLDQYSAQYSTILSGAIRGTDYARNLCVIKTHAGMANAACAALDSMNKEGVVGTIAGDDTIFVCCRTDEDARALSVFLDGVKGY